GYITVGLSISQQNFLSITFATTKTLPSPDDDPVAVRLRMSNGSQARQSPVGKSRRRGAPARSVHLGAARKDAKHLRGPVIRVQQPMVHGRVEVRAVARLHGDHLLAVLEGHLAVEHHEELLP